MRLEVGAILSQYLIDWNSETNCRFAWDFIEKSSFNERVFTGKIGETRKWDAT